MTELLDHLGKDSLPPELESAFVHWCVWQQAHPAMVDVLERVALHDLAAELRATDDLHHLTAVSERAARLARKARETSGPLGLSAAEAAAFELGRLAQAASDAGWDPQSVAFFSIRLSGWAGWVGGDFGDKNQKAEAEDNARAKQEQHLRMLWREHGQQQG